jgi:hypothetical protein
LMKLCIRFYANIVNLVLYREIVHRVGISDKK